MGKASRSKDNARATLSPAEAAAQPQPGVDAPGVSLGVGRCAGCSQAVRNAVLQGPDLQAPAIRVNAQPTEMILADGRVLSLFVPHDNTCKSPQVIHVPGGVHRVG